MEKKLYVVPKTTLFITTVSLCEDPQWSIKSTQSNEQWSKDFDDEEDFDDSPWED